MLRKPNRTGGGCGILQRVFNLTNTLIDVLHAYDTTQQHLFSHRCLVGKPSAPRCALRSTRAPHASSSTNRCRLNNTPHWQHRTAEQPARCLHAGGARTHCSGAAALATRGRPAQSAGVRHSLAPQPIPVAINCSTILRGQQSSSCMLHASRLALRFARRGVGQGHLPACIFRRAATVQASGHRTPAAARRQLPGMAAAATVAVDPHSGSHASTMEGITFL